MCLGVGAWERGERTPHLDVGSRLTPRGGWPVPRVKGMLAGKSRHFGGVHSRLEAKSSPPRETWSVCPGGRQPTGGGAPSRSAGGPRLLYPKPAGLRLRLVRNNAHSSIPTGRWTSPLVAVALPR